MMKFILGLVALGMGGVILRMALVKAGLARKPRKSAEMTRLKRELDLLLWIPPALIAIGGAWAIGAAIWSNWSR
ncbi:MAG TPA: hypothetical protein VIL72_12655 [Beijerinckiaceae bacterium]|jgi:hypothetical protein